MNGIRTICLNGADMRRVHFRASPTIDELEAGHGTTLIVSTQHNPAKNAVPNGARRQLHLAVTPLLENIGRLPFLKARVFV